MFIYLNSTYIKSEFVLIGVIQELLTIPCLLLQPILLFIALLKLFKGNYKRKGYLIVASSILLISIVTTWISFLK